VLEYHLAGKKIIFTHAFVPPALQGQGLGSCLVRAGLDYARTNGLTVVPLCPFVGAYLRKHPEDQDLMR
jgi:predicted GNAT family acetyltransferase